MVHDADAHIMETPSWLRDHADPGMRDRIEPLPRSPAATSCARPATPTSSSATSNAAFDRLRAKHASDEYRATEAAEIMHRKNFAATGSFIADDRPRALDLLGFSSQLVFNTFHNRRLHDWEHGGDLDLAYGAARPTTAAWSSSARSTHACCPRATCRWPTSTGPRPWPTRRSRWAPPRCSSRRGARRATRRATSARPGVGPGPGGRHPGRVPRRRHRRPDRRELLPQRPPDPPDFHGGEENFRSVDYMGIPGPPAQTLATMIFDGVLERFPALRIGVIEQGAIWVPSWMRQMESAFEAFLRHEERLQALSMRPSDYVRRQVRFTPYPDRGRRLDHRAGRPRGVHVLVRLPPRRRWPQAPRALRGVARRRGDEVRRRFYCDNFLDLMGTAGCRAKKSAAKSTSPSPGAT